MFPNSQVRDKVDNIVVNSSTYTIFVSVAINSLLQEFLCHFEKICYFMPALASGIKSIYDATQSDHPVVPILLASSKSSS